MTDNQSPKVSVCITTYNHEQFITQAIESVLMQQTSFDYEILIGDDDSTDGTRGIVKDFKQKYPKKIKLFLNDRKNVIYIDGKPTGRWNFSNNLRHAQGQYIALLDGDDYWISPDKLQKQVDFLDGHLDYALCFHNAHNLLPDGTKHDYIREGFGQGPKSIYTFDDILFQNFLPTCSAMFRNHLVEELPDMFYRFPFGDWFFYTLNAQYGQIGYIDEFWGVRRRHAGGLVSRMSQIDIWKTNIKCIEMICEYYGIDYRLNEGAKSKLLYFLNLLMKQFSNMGDGVDVKYYLDMFNNLQKPAHTIHPIINNSGAREKIVVVTEAFPVVTETFILDQITGLLDRGADIEIWTGAKIAQSHVHQDIDTYNLLDRTKYLRYPEAKDLTTEQWGQAFLEINNINNVENTSFHVHFGPSFNRLAPFFAVHPDKFVLVSFHGYDASKYIEMVGNDCYSYLFQRANLITTPSVAMKDKLVKIGADVQKIKVHHYGVNLKQFRPDPAMPAGNLITFLSVSRMVPKKGLELSLRAFAQIAQEYNAIYKVIGEGPLYPQIINLIRSLNIEDKVMIEGVKDKTGIITEMSQSDIFVLTSLTASDGDQEGLPVSLIEAQAMGLPVISTFHAGIPELVLNYQTGLLAPEGDIEAIANHMRKLSSDDQLRLRFGQNGRLKVVTEFDIDKLNDQLLGYFTSNSAKKTIGTPSPKTNPVSLLTPPATPGNPSISIIIPTYNRANYLPQAIASALAQIRPADEILIVDDGSTDNTTDIVKAFTWPNIRYVRKDHTGAPDTRNRGVLEAKGDFILWLDSDDIITPYTLKAYMQMLAKYPDADIFYGQLQSIDIEGNNGHLFTYGDWYDDQAGMLAFLMVGAPVPNPCTMIRRNIFTEIGLYNTYFKRAHDYEFWSRVVASQRYKAKYVDQVLCYYRIHDSNLTGHLSQQTDYQYERKILSTLLNKVPLHQLFPNLNWGKKADVAQADAFFQISQKYFTWHGVEEGLDYLIKSIDINPLPERINALAVQLAKAGHFNEAYRLLKEAQRRDPANKEILENLRLVKHQISPTHSKNDKNNHRKTPEDTIAKLANICMVTFNRLEFTKQAINSIVKNTRYPYVLTVVDNNSSDGTQKYLKNLHRRGIIKNLVLLPENVGVAKASNIAWHQVPDAEYYVKYDNDIVIKESNWLVDLVKVVEDVPQVGMVGYNFEPQSYPTIQLNGHNLRISNRSLGGACILIPKRTERVIGYWCEDYGLYGEEDADFGYRVKLAGLLNVYMENEDIGLHLPAGKAARINPQTLAAEDGLEEEAFKEYRFWKDEQRRKNVIGGKYQKNLAEYEKGIRPLFVETKYYKAWASQNFNQGEAVKVESSYSDELIASKKQNVKVSIIIPVFNKLEFTRKCLETLFRHMQIRDTVEVIVVDNASTDDTSAYLEKAIAQYPHLHVLRNPENLGFAKACNLGASVTSGQYLLFLNNDTEVQSGWLEPLIRILDNDQTVAAVGSKLLFPDNTIQHAGVVVINDQQLPDPLVARHIYYRKAGDHPQVNQIRTYQALTAACLMVRKSAFETVSGFDENYWNGYEDVDLCFKFRERGWLLVYQPDSVVIHYESQSGAERFRQVQHNIERLHTRWLGKIKPDAVIESNGNQLLTTTQGIGPYISSTHLQSRPVQGSLTSIIILTHNQLEHTKLCLESIAAHTPEQHELIIIDNGSTDGTLNYLRQYQAVHSHIRIIANSNNRGFAAGNNQGLIIAQGDNIVLLNNDTVVTKGWLSRMLAVFEQHPEVGLVGPMTNHVSGPQRVPDAPYDNMIEMHQFAASWAAAHIGQSAEFFRVVGFCLVARRAVIERIGGLDEQFGSGNFEDDDFCLRAAMVGFNAHIVQDVFIHHTGNQTFKGAGIDYDQSLERNWILLKKKWHIPTYVRRGPNYFPYISFAGKDPSAYFVPLPSAETVLKLQLNNQATLALVLATDEVEQPNQLAACLTHLEKYLPRQQIVGVYVGGNQDKNLLTNGNFVPAGISPSTWEALEEALQSNANYVVLLSSDVTVTEGWLENLLAVANADATIAAAGPMANTAPTIQFVKKHYKSLGKELQKFAVRRAQKYNGDWEPVPYLGGFCLLLKTHTLRVVGGLNKDLTLPEALFDLYKRQQSYGFKLACARGVYVHHEYLSVSEGAAYDNLFAAQTAISQTLSPGQVALEQGDFEAAASAFAQATKQYPELAAAHTALGSVLMALNRFEEAVPPLRRAAELVPQVASTHNQVGVALCGSERFDEAEVAFKTAKQVAPDDLTTLLNLVDLYRAQQNYEEASVAIKEALTLDSNHPEVLVAFGLLCLDLDDREGAELAWQRLPKGPTDYPGIQVLGQALGYNAPEFVDLPRLLTQVQTAQADGDWLQAIALLEPVLDSVSPLTDFESVDEIASLWNKLGYSYFMNNQPVNAEAVFRRGLEFAPEQLDLLSNLADLYLQQENFVLASEYLNRALRVDPNDANVLLTLGNCSIQLGAFDTALLAFRRVQTLAPGTEGVKEVVSELELMELNPI